MSLIPTSRVSPEQEHESFEDLNSTAENVALAQAAQALAETAAAQAQDIIDTIGSNDFVFNGSAILNSLLGVDGPGSALNADLLDGFEAAYFAPASDVLTPVPMGAVFTDTVYDDTSLSQSVTDNSNVIVALTSDLASLASRVLTDVPAGAVFTDTVYDDTALTQEILDNTNAIGVVSSALASRVLTDVPNGAVFTDTVYDDSIVSQGISDNTNAIGTVASDLAVLDGRVLTDVPLNAVFTDTVYDDSFLAADVLSNTSEIGTINTKLLTPVPVGAVFTDTIFDASDILNDIALINADLLTPVPVGAVFTDTVYDDTTVTNDIADINGRLLTPVPNGAVFTDTVYDDTTVVSDISNNENAITALNNRVLTDVPVGAVFTDTVYDDTAIQSEVDLNTVHANSAHSPVENGFVDRADSTISFDDGTRTFTIAPAVDNFEYFYGGTSYIISGSEQIVIPDTEGLHFIYYDGSTLSVRMDFVPEILTLYAFVCVIYWDADNNEAIYVGDERHGNTMDSTTHLYNHSTAGSRYDSGLALLNIDADGNGDLDSHAQLAVADGVIWDEDIRVNIANNTPQSLNPIAQIPVFYRSGAAGYWRRISATNFPITTTGSGRAAYNEYTGAVWQLTEVGNNDFALVHILATPDINHPVIAIMGQKEYVTSGEARTGATTELNELLFGPLDDLTPEMVVIATVIFQTSNVKDNPVKSSIETTEDGFDYIDWRKLNTPGSGIASNASAWGAISGSIANQTDLQVALNAKANSADVYTEAETDTAISNAVTPVSSDLASLEGRVLTDVPAGAVFTDTVYDDTAIQAAVDLNTAKVSNVDHPLVETAVPIGAVFTDTVFDDSSIVSDINDINGRLLTPVPIGAVFTDTVYNDSSISSDIAAINARLLTDVPFGAVFTDTVYDDSSIVSDIANINGRLLTDVPAGAVFTDTVYDDTTLATNISNNANAISAINARVLTDVPVGAVFTDTVYDDTALQAAVALNTAKVSNVDHPLVQTAVPPGAVFTDTVYNDSSISNDIANINSRLLTDVPAGAVFTDTVYDDTDVVGDIANINGRLLTPVPLGAVFTDTDTVYNDTSIVNDIADINGRLLTDVPAGAVFTDTVYDDTSLAAAVALNTAKVSNVNHPLVEKAVPANAVFTDTVYDDSTLQAAVALNTAKVSNVDHPLVQTAVPPGAVFTDTVYNDASVVSDISDINSRLLTDVPPGALFTDTIPASLAALDSVAADKLNDIQANATDGAEYLNNVTNRPETFLVRSVGNQCTAVSPTSRGIYNDTNDWSFKAGRSLGLTVWNRNTSAIISNTTYDIYGSGTAADDLATALNALDENYIIIVHTYDEPTNQLNNNARTAMYRCGASYHIFGNPDVFKYHGAYILIGIPGIGEGNGTEVYSGKTASDPDAWCETHVTIHKVPGLDMYTTGNRSIPLNFSPNADVTLDQLAGRGVNICHYQYSTFDGEALPTSIYTSEALLEQDATSSVVSGKSLKITATADNGVVYFGLGSGDYNLNLEPGKKWIYSVYVKSDIADVFGQIGIKTTDGTKHMANFYTSSTIDEWTRISAIFDFTSTSSNESSGILRCDVEINGQSIWFDGFMFEEQIGNNTNPSPYVFPVIPRVLTDKVDSITAGADVTEDKLTDGSLNGITVSGIILQTTDTDNRVELTSYNSIDIYDSGNVKTQINKNGITIDSLNANTNSAVIDILAWNTRAIKATSIGYTTVEATCTAGYAINAESTNNYAINAKSTDKFAIQVTTDSTTATSGGIKSSIPVGNGRGLETDGGTFGVYASSTLVGVDGRGSLVGIRGYAGDDGQTVNGIAVQGKAYASGGIAINGIGYHGGVFVGEENGIKTEATTNNGSSYPLRVIARSAQYGIYVSNAHVGLVTTGAVYIGAHVKGGTYGLIGYSGENGENNGHGVYGRADGSGGRGVWGKGYTGVYCQGTTWAAYFNGSTGPFTGAHDVLIAKNESWEPGDIVVVVETVAKPSLIDTIHRVIISDKDDQKSAYGVIYKVTELKENIKAPEVGSEGKDKKDKTEDEIKKEKEKELKEEFLRPIGMKDKTKQEYADWATNYYNGVVPAIGEGQINVCDQGGDIEIGDFISTSATKGKGKRYDGNDMRVVVAKAMENVVWSEIKKKTETIACVYMCG